MGVDYFAINIDKRQYYMPIGNNRYKWMFWGIDGHALACLINGAVDDDLLLESWAGDAIYIINDASVAQMPDHCYEDEEKDKALRRDDASIIQEDYDNITLNILASLYMENSHVSDYFKEHESDDCKFMKLAHTAINLDSPKFLWSFEADFGKQWSKRYNKLYPDRSDMFYYSGPMTHSNRKNHP